MKIFAYKASLHDRNGNRFRTIRNCMLLSGLSVFAQLYLFQPMLSDLRSFFQIGLSLSSLSVSASTLGMAAGLLLFAFKADAFARERLMGFSLLLSSVLTLLSAFSLSFPWLVVLSFFKGMALSGVSSVALAYLAEEVSPSLLGLAVSLYLGGNTLGGMAGRVAGGLLCGWGGWRVAVLVLGTVCLFLGILFVRLIPPSRYRRSSCGSFCPDHGISAERASSGSISVGETLLRMKRLLSSPLFISLYLLAALAMGVFVSVYNYLPFRLESPVFGLSHRMVAMIFLMYAAGIAGSLAVGSHSERFGIRQLLQGELLLMVAGLVMLLSSSLWMVVAGLGVFTFAFFGAHTLASRMVAQCATQARSSATCLYWLAYYAGSSLAGSLTGMILSHGGWTAFVGTLLLMVVGAWSLTWAVPSSVNNKLIIKTKQV